MNYNDSPPLKNSYNSSIPVPTWIEEAVDEARKLFGLGPEWSIFIYMTDKPNGDQSAGGTASPNSVYLNADIELSVDLLNNQVGRNHVFHEVLHVAHSSVDHMVSTVLDQLPEQLQNIMRGQYHDAVENFTQRISRSITKEK